MPKYGLIACFSQVNKPDISEHKFDRYGLAKIGSWKMEKKMGRLAFQKVAKTGDIGKKVQRQAILIMQDTSACRRLISQSQLAMKTRQKDREP